MSVAARTTANAAQDALETRLRARADFADTLVQHGLPAEEPREDDRTYGQRRPIWDLNVSNETLLQDNPPLVIPLNHAHALPQPRVLDDTADEIEQLLSRASKRSAA